jgi:hypothetical protein
VLDNGFPGWVAETDGWRRGEDIRSHSNFIAFCPTKDQAHQQALDWCEAHQDGPPPYGEGGRRGLPGAEQPEDRDAGGYDGSF